MTLVDFLRGVRDRSIAENVGEVIVGYRRRTGWLDRRSTHVFDREWDVLCVLDACRYDLLAEVAPEYPSLDDAESIYSVGATSPMWLENTFGPLSAAELETAAYLTGNPWSGRLDLPFESLAAFEELWRTTWDEDGGYQPPRPLTDRAISLWRERDDLDRLIVHYMQPHVPFVDDPELTRTMGVTEESPEEKTVWKKVRDGELDRDRVWAAYADNLRFVLEEVDLLRRNLDADTLAVSSDHGNAMGELGQAGHKYGALVRSACEVPWVELDPTDTGSHDPDSWPVPERADGSTDDAVSDRLAALGYTD